MKISIITASYNSGKTIRHTVESVLRQTYPDYEYIVIDGGSTDNSIDVVKEYQVGWEFPSNKQVIKLAGSKMVLQSETLKLTFKGF